MGRRLGVMGGTFDPIHHGHLVAAEEARWTFRLDEVLFVPAGRPWMKGHRELADGEHRHRMTELATQGEEAFTVSRMELDREGPTHTVETLRQLRTERPEVDELFFITGADALADLPQWREPAEALELATFIGASRPGYDLDRAVASLAAELGAAADRVQVLDVPALAISSSDIRDRVKDGRPFRYQVPDGVHDYIEEQELYR